MGTANGFTNPEVITRSVAPNETLRLFVDNNSRTQSMNYTVSVRVN